MFDVTTFLTRWLFVSNLVRDVAEVQTLPFQPYQPTAPPPPSPNRRHAEEIWRDRCIRGILSYPPGTQRSMVMDALRTDLVHQLCLELGRTNDVLRRNTAYKRTMQVVPPSSIVSDDDIDEGTAKDDDPFLDADVEIVRAFEEASEVSVKEDSAEATLVISRNETKVMDSSGASSTSEKKNSTKLQPLAPPTSLEVDQAYRTTRNVRDYLPQLVSAVLKSPPAFDPNLSNPIQKLRQLILRQCLHDPSWGIELCWLLEAEVGRAWKTLFEHRQQTGRRLIVVLPAEKAAVLAQIGTEKREAFDLLQDAEQATAYGYTVDESAVPGAFGGSGYSTEGGAGTAGDTIHDAHLTSRLPSSISLRRCSHFGDTMHFIDRLTKVSLDLRSVPTAQREAYLHESLYDMNRRMRRRMVTKGDVSLDVEDSRSPHDWPQLSDLSVEHLKFSIHLPLVPQSGTWPSGTEESTAKRHVDTPSPEVVRVLNIVVPESRILASRERCPFLVHLEVADTGLEGSDARLYASGASGLGSTVEEALSMNAASASASVSRRRQESFGTHVPYEIPAELLDEYGRLNLPKGSILDKNVAMQTDVGRKRKFPRGGWQADDQFYHDHDNTGYVYTNPYDVVRQHEFEQLHRQMQSEQVPPPQRTISITGRLHTMGHELLNKVFGSPWNEKCNEIRASSPYGHIKGWRLASFILKAGEDIRREALVMQVISKLRDWFREEIPEAQRPFMRTYTIMCVGGDAGLLECLSDAKSVDEVKKRTDGFVSLRNYFERAYKPAAFIARAGAHGKGHWSEEDQISFETAQDNFLRSLVGYSLVCYILQIKDRHNANILLDREGHIIHIDFGFVLGDTPKMGRVPLFYERAPFKLSAEFWEVLGGWNISERGLGVKFCKMFEVAFACASLHADEIATLVESTMLALTSNPRSSRIIANGVRSRLRMRGPPGSVEQKMFIMDLVNAALTSWGTSTYDWLQRNMNGYQ